MSTAWYYVGGFTVAAWLLLTVGLGVKLGKFQVHGHWLLTVLGIVAAVLAGLAATATQIYNATGAVVNLFAILRFAAFLLVIVVVVLTVAAIVPDAVHGFTAGTALALTWIAVPSLLKHGVVPGEAGRAIESLLTQLTQPIVANTRWFG